MFLKRLIKFASYTLMVGVCLILGFLSFSGIYILAPILPLAIAAFFLSIIYEGEIYYQNITKAIKGLRKPNYLESKVAEECLLEAVEDIQQQYKEIDPSDLNIIKALEEIRKIKEEFGDTRIDNATIIERSIERYKKAIKISEEIQNETAKNILNELLLNNEGFICERLNARTKKSKIQDPGVVGGFGNQDFIERDAALMNSLDDILNINIYPQFLIDYAYIAKLGHSYSHLKLNSEDAEKSKNLQLSLSMMEKVFTEQLFPSKSKNNKTPTSNAAIAEHEDSEERAANESKLQEYKASLKEYLKDKGYTDKYEAILKRRKPWAIFNKALATVCGLVMILGTSYLLIEAFTVIPLLSAIPFGILPAVVVPLSIIAGFAYGIITYHALDEMLNSDVITSRIAKIKQDIKEGLGLYTGAKLVVFTLLLALAITLTVCTGGTWYNVIKHTKPVFSWLSKIPAWVSGFIAGILGIGALAFNTSNSAQSTAEIEEMIESQAPEDHPYNIDLLEVEEGKDIKTEIRFVPRTAIIKQGDKYFIHSCNKNHKERDLGNWQIVEVNTKSYWLKSLIQKLDFKKNVLYFSITNSLLYSRIRANTQHKFNPSKENWTQFLNPIRFILLITYVPLRIIFFLGHLASISATADRVPGIPEIITMIIGFVAELFEDLHYFTNFKHEHKPDVAGIVEERLKEGGGHDHSNDLPTRILRNYLFVPLFWLAAHWHSYFSDRKDTTNPGSLKTSEPSVSYEDAYEIMRGEDPVSSPKFIHNDKSSVIEINSYLLNEANSHKQEILDSDDLAEISGIENKLLSNVILANKRPSRISSFGIFATHANCKNPRCSVARNTLVLQP